MTPICSKCKVKERAVSRNGRIWSYCRECTRKVKRDYTMRPYVRAKHRKNPLYCQNCGRYLERHRKKWCRRCAPLIQRDYIKGWNNGHYPKRLEKDLEQYNFSKKANNAIMFDGVLLDKQLKKRGLTK